MKATHLVLLAAIAFLALFLHRAADLYDIRYTTSDDIDYQLNSLGTLRADGPWELGRRVAADQGRLTALFRDSAYAAVNSIKTQRVYDTLNLGAFFVAVASVAAILWRRVGAPFSLAFAVCFWGLFPQLWHHSPPSAYPVVPWIPVIAFGAYCYFFHRYLATHSYGHAVAFVLSYTAALVQYELFWLLIPPLAAAIAISCFREQSHARSNKLLVASSLILVPAVYVSLSMAYGTQGGDYAGTSLAELNLSRTATTVFQFSLGSLSLFHVLRGTYEIFFFDSISGAKVNLIPAFSLVDLVRESTALDWSVALLGALTATVCVRLMATSTLSSKALLATIAMGAFIAIGSVLPYAVTPKYQAWAAGEHVVYLGSRYSYLGLIVVLVGSVALVFRFLEKRSPLALKGSAYAVLGLATVVGFVATSSFNERVSRTMKINAAKWQALNVAVRCEPVLNAMAGRTITAPELWNRVWYSGIRSGDYWTRYAKHILGVPMAFRRDGQHASPDDGVYLGYRADRLGRILAIFLATDYREGTASRFMLLTPRGVDVSLTHGTGRDHEHLDLSEGRPGASSCGEYVLSYLEVRPVQVGSLNFAAFHRAQLVQPAGGEKNVNAVR